MATLTAPARPDRQHAERGCISFLGAPVFAVDAWLDDADLWAIRTVELDLVGIGTTRDSAAEDLGDKIFSLFLFLADLAQEEMTDSEEAQFSLIARRLGPPLANYEKALRRAAFWNRLRAFFRRTIQWRLEGPSTHDGSEPVLSA